MRRDEVRLIGSRIAVVVHGRFYAFDFVRELIRQGRPVTLFTNYPKSVVERLGVPADAIESYLLHGVYSRLLQKLGSAAGRPLGEASAHRLFGKWAADRVARGNFDVIHCFSGVAEEVFRHSGCQSKLKVLVRASAHIDVQRKLLEEEEQRSRISIDKPSDWMVERERREYKIADKIVVLSSFAYRSFVDCGISPSRLWLLPLAVDVSQFRSTAEVVKGRLDRLLAGQPIRVLTTGSFSVQKGAIDYARIVESTYQDFEYRWVGPVPAEGRAFKERLSGKMSFIPKVDQFKLRPHYEWADLYLFPTIQDGFPVVLTQAQAAGLPILATENCSAPDILQEGENGWVMPIRSADKFLERLEWCNSHRHQLAQVARYSFEKFKMRDWADVAVDFSRLIAQEGRSCG